MNHIQRRTFLQLAGAGAALAWMPGVTRLYAQKGRSSGGATPTLVCIYLRGGLDALNAVVPYKDERYLEMRPTIAVPPEDDADMGPGVLKIDDTFGLHPSMRSLLPYWEKGRLAAVVNCGSPHPTRSHFDAQDFMEYGAPGVRTLKEGWLNRYLHATQEPADKGRKQDDVVLRALAMQGLLPRALRGQRPVLAVPGKRVLENARVTELFEELYGEPAMDERRDDPVVEVGRDTLETLELYRKTLDANRGGSDVQYPNGGLGSSLRDLAAIVQADVGLEVACVDVLGWDLHANQGGSDGRFTELLADLSDSVAAFAQDIGERLDRTLVLVVTEFGRTCRENGNQGTDHGRGGAMFLLGGAVKGGRVFGKWDGLADRDLVEGRDLPVTTDFRDLFGEVLAQHLGFDLPKGFFPGYTPRPVRDLF